MAWLLLFLFGWVAAHAETVGNVATAAASPYELATFVDTHSDFDWAPLWKTLNINYGFMPSCDKNWDATAPCSSELITIVDPFQVVLILEHRSSMYQVFLRYRREGASSWRFAGAYAPFVKYFRPEHQVTRFGTIPYLLVTGEGTAGLGLSRKTQDWIDLTREDFRPVFAYTTEGHDMSHQGIGRVVRGQVVSLETEPVPRITAVYDIEFKALEGADDIPLGSVATKPST